MYQTGYYATGYYETGYYMRLVGGVSTGFTYAGLLDEARFMLADDNSLCYRYTDEELVAILNRALNDLNRYRPDAWYTYYGQYVDNVPEITDNFLTVGDQIHWTATFQPDMNFYDAVLNYVVGMAQVTEDPYMESGEAQTHLDMFRNLVLRT